MVENVDYLAFVSSYIVVYYFSSSVKSIPSLGFTSIIIALSTIYKLTGLTYENFSYYVFFWSCPKMCEEKWGEWFII